MPSFLETLQEFNTPQPQRDKYIFMYRRLSVVLWLWKGGLLENSHMFCIVILDLHSF